MPRDPLWMGLQRVRRHIFRIVAEAVVVAIVLGVTYWMWQAYESWRLADRVSTVRRWAPTVLPLGTRAKASLVTRCAALKLYYQLQLEPVLTEAGRSEREPKPDVLKERAVAKMRQEMSSYIVKFYDADGFKISEFDLPVSALDHRVDDQGKGIALSAEGSEACDPAVYDRATSVVVAWRWRAW